MALRSALSLFQLIDDRPLVLVGGSVARQVGLRSVRLHLRLELDFLVQVLDLWCSVPGPPIVEDFTSIGESLLMDERVALLGLYRQALGHSVLDPSMIAVMEERVMALGILVQVLDPSLLDERLLVFQDQKAGDDSSGTRCREPHFQSPGCP